MRRSSSSSEPNDGTIRVLAAGDVFPDVADLDAAFRPLAPLLADADCVFGNCEGVYADDPSPAPSHRHAMIAGRRRGEGLGRYFDVMTCANNHIVDGGYGGLSETLSLLRDEGIATVGAGPDLETATRPAVVRFGEATVAFLGFCSVFPVGYEARQKRPGLAPLRVLTHYDEPDRSFWEPGATARVTTAAMTEDHERVRSAIAEAARLHDHVVVAFHWGISRVLEEVGGYERELARDAIRHGARAVVCHHHHALRGVELLDGRPIYYGLGALVHHFQPDTADHVRALPPVDASGSRRSLGGDPEYPLFPFAPEARRTGFATLELGPGERVRAGFAPAEILPDGSTRPLAADSAEGERVAVYLESLSAATASPPTVGRGERGGLMHLELRPG